MALRSRYVGPDEMKRTPAGDIAVVSRQAQLDAIMEVAIVADFSGGGFSVFYERAETGIANERVTTAIVLTWQDRGQAKAQPESDLALTPAALQREQTAESEVPAAPTVSARLERLAEREGWVCHLCGGGIDPEATDDDMPTADHLVPRSAGGGDGLDNLKLAHRRCNQERADAPLDAQPVEA